MYWYLKEDHEFYGNKGTMIGSNYRFLPASHQALFSSEKPKSSKNVVFTKDDIYEQLKNKFKAAVDPDNLP